ncbi:hypothetical protein D3C87_1202720 [compost metagenome]
MGAVAALSPRTDPRAGGIDERVAAAANRIEPVPVASAGVDHAARHRHDAIEVGFHPGGIVATGVDRGVARVDPGTILEGHERVAAIGRHRAAIDADGRAITGPHAHITAAGEHLDVVQADAAVCVDGVQRHRVVGVDTAAAHVDGAAAHGRQPVRAAAFGRDRNRPAAIEDADSAAFGGEDRNACRTGCRAGLDGTAIIDLHFNARREDLSGQRRLGKREASRGDHGQARGNGPALLAGPN